MHANRNKCSLLARSGLLAASALGMATAVSCGTYPLFELIAGATWTATSCAGAFGLAVATAWWVLIGGRLFEPYESLQDEHDRAAQIVADRTRTVDRLLEFSQTILGAGKADQILQCLCFFLRSELGLAGLAILTHDADAGGSIQVRASWPEGLINDAPLSEMEVAACPCMRQNLPRQFNADESPVRCAVDRVLRMPPAHPACCIPFTLGGKTQYVVHMLLPQQAKWTESLQQLAQTYVNTACSTLGSLQLLEEAEQRSMTDPLTQLYNRRSLEQLLQREVALAERHGHPLSVVMLDMDNFKLINDSHGHAAGDHLLRALADCVRITLRRTDLAFRYGGDEFVIALPQTPLHQAQQVVEKLRQAFAAVDFSSAIANLEHQPTLSIGVAERSKQGNILSLSSLIGAADHAMYEAKNSTRDCVRVYQPSFAA